MSSFYCKVLDLNFSKNAAITQPPQQLPNVESKNIFHSKTQTVNTAVVWVEQLLQHCSYNTMYIWHCLSISPTLPCLLFWLHSSAM